MQDERVIRIRVVTPFALFFARLLTPLKSGRLLGEILGRKQ